MNARSVLIRLQQVTRSFLVGQEHVHALANVSFEIARGEYVSILGPSGSGKSTLLNVLGCLDTPTRGTYQLADHDVSTLNDDQLSHLRNNEIGFVFQSFHLLPRESVLDNVALPLEYRGVARRERVERARQALELVRMTHRCAHFPNQLSGGERQRVAVARAIVTEPSLLLCDEPTGNLDRRIGLEVTREFEHLNARYGLTLVIVTHDRGLAQRAPRWITLTDGQLDYDGPSLAA